MRARFLLQVHLKPGCEEDFLRAYRPIADRVARGVPGHLVHQLCQSVDDPQNWLITTEWETMEACLEWERSPEHRELVKPLRECWDEAKSAKYLVQVDTRH
jgi:heme oxygenase (mycobilin-producing)